MSSGVAVVGLDSAGGPHIGGGNTTFTLNGIPVVVAGDPVTPHGESPHLAPVMAMGSSWMTWNGVPVVAAGHAASCGHASTGQPWFTIPL